MTETAQATKADGMTTPTGLRPRPVSPHLQVYRFTPTMATSILHRITGVALYGAMLLLVWWLLALSTSVQAYAAANAVLGSWFGLLVLAGVSFAMWLHLLGGLRHFLWDTGVGTEKAVSTKLAIVSVVAAILLTVLTWIVFFAIA